jgi:benzodiazapine receptor
MNNIWYNTLNKSKLTPSDSVFPIVWSLLYITIFISFCMIIYSSGLSHQKALVFFTIQMILNLLWAPVFFKQQNIRLSLIIILCMWIFIVLTLLEFFKMNKYAGLLLIPYLLWVSFAIYLNAFIYFKNELDSHTITI